MAGAAEWPLGGLLHETGHHRIPLGVGHKLLEAIPASHHVVEGLFLPHLSLAIQLPVDLVGGIRLPRLKNPGQRVLDEGRHHSMDVVRHHAPGAHCVALALKMKQRVFDDRGQLGVPQDARARRGIEIRLICDLRPILILGHPSPFDCPLSRNIKQAERHKVGATGFAQMRQNPAIRRI
jgi:hypothetical protein